MAIIQQSLVNTGLPQTPEGVPSELFSAFMQVYQAIGNLQQAISLYGGVDSLPTDWWPQLTIDDTFFDGNLNRLIAVANENISFGQAVSPILVGGALQLRLANATNNTRWCCGFSITPGTILAGAPLEIKTRGKIDGIVGMTIAGRYWVSTIAGSVQNTPPVAAGNIEQVVGFAATGSRLICSLDSFFIQH